MKNKETRSVKVEMRKVGESRKLVGTAIVYESESEDMGFIEVIERGAATEAIEKSDARALYGHNSDTLLPLGRMSAGTLDVTETRSGVDVEIDLPDTTFANDLAIAVERGDIQDMSFAFTVADDAWETRDGKDYRIIKKFDEIFDFSYVAYPAYQDTQTPGHGISK